ncbi:MAG: N-acetyltransferase [Bradymonadales bacterium]|nr:MAG: N-acetyltransferase [Bradymonadales bacterium]
MDDLKVDLNFKGFTSTRLKIRRFRPEDAPSLQAYREDPEVAMYQYWSTCTLSEAQEFVETQARQTADIQGEWLQIAVECLHSKEHLGDIAFRTCPSSLDTTFFGASFSRRAQGKGYASEALAHLFYYLFEQRNKRRLVGITDCRNEASVRLLERLGFRREAHFIENLEFKGELVSEYLYALLRKDWPSSPAFRIYLQSRRENS